MGVSLCDQAVPAAIHEASEPASVMPSSRIWPLTSSR